MPQGFTSWTMMIMPPGAFFILAIFMWIARRKQDPEEKGAK